MKKSKKNDSNKCRCTVGGVGIDFIGKKKAFKTAKTLTKYNKKHQITTPNPEQIVLAQKDEEFKNILNQADLAVPDGIGLVLGASFLYGNKKNQCRFKRVSGADLMIQLCKDAAKEGKSVFLLGGEAGVAKQAAAVVKNDFGVVEVGFWQGSINIKKETAAEKIKTKAKINQFKPDYLFVAYGAPFQEKWIANNLKELDVKVAMGVGGSFDYLAGKIKRAPLLIRKLGLEWLWRLLKEPWRWKRQLRLLKFIGLVLKEKISRN
jgi:N-acetylglucosaminyldiphosphoundecaprenol N-acetyl-beta-D-mannosaminyltransferase